MELKQARTEAIKLANLTGVSHVIVNAGHNYIVYPQKSFDGVYVEIVEPAKNIDSIYIEETKPEEVKPKKVNVSKKA